MLSQHYPQLILFQKQGGESQTEWVNKTFMDELENINMEKVGGDLSDVDIVVRIVNNDDFKELKGIKTNGFTTTKTE